jgi:DNA-binding MarR family transcriptional regulator/N-acetylglutamate synthase-like GNAT family acetyltransferase
MPAAELERRIAAVRRFTRFYTQRIGVLQEGLLQSRFSLTQGRVLYELANRAQPTASELAKDLGLDAGYLSRILRGFERQGLLRRTASKSDGRQNLLAITDRGRKAFAPLNARSREEIGTMLRQLSLGEQESLVDAMGAVERLLGAPRETRAPYVLRPPAPGDMGWVVSRHGALYAHEYGFDQEFEALVAEIVAKFVQTFDGKRERCWIAERDGDNVGSVFVVRRSATVARLRLLLVEPKARGLGIGARLVDECVRFAREARYRKITLWTHSVLTAARHIYEQAGFTLVDSWTHNDFGKELVGENWDLRLASGE